MIDGLRPYQATAALWLSDHARGYLADPPGLGKTRELLAGAGAVEARRVLVIAPAVALAHWHREWDVMVLAGAIAPGTLLMVASYQKFVLNATTRAEAALFAPDVVILDEAHMLKHRDSKRSIEVLLRNAVLDAKYVWAASGTPMPRNPYELYPIVRSLWPDEMVRDLKIVSHDQWRERFTFWKWSNFGPKVYAAKNVEMLRAFLKGKLLRRNEKDVLPELPPIRWTTFPLSIEPETARDAFDATVGLSPEAIITPDRAPTGHIARARKALGLLKVPYALELIAREMLDSPEEKRIVFAYHRDVLTKLREGLAPFGVAYIDGSTPLEKRAAAERAFQTDPDVRVFVGQNEAAGLSLTLTAAHRVDLVEPDWRTDFNVQDGKRAHRFGQEHSVLVRMLSMADTLDEALVAQHHRETKMRGEVLD